MTTPKREGKWWGWGDEAHMPELDESAIGMLRERLGDLKPASRPERAEQVELPEVRPLPDAVTDAVGADRVFDGAEDRVRHSAGKGYVDLALVRSGKLEHAPDAVLVPDEAQIEPLLAACSASGVAVVPFGGGTSVVGGVEPRCGGRDRVISLDLSELEDVEIDRTSLTARLGAGLLAPDAEQRLNREGFTLGHFPQSYELATIGGFAATRSAGQASSGYGRFDEMVTSVRLIAPGGTMSTREVPHTAAGPALRELILGSEGVLGVIPDVTVRIHELPEASHYEAWMAESWESGTEAVRDLAQAGELPDVIRVSDEEETSISLGLSGPRGIAGAAFNRYLSLRKRSGGCLMIVGVLGEREAVARRRALAARRLRDSGAVYLGRSAGESWHKNRFEGPYLRDALLDAGCMVETLETAHEWSRLPQLYSAVGTALSAALEGQGTPGIVFCHLSHAYEDGASLYFTFVGRRLEGSEVEQWRACKEAACEAIVGAGGTITHHHAIGRDHAPYMNAEVGETGLDVLRAVKEQLDPAGILNPTKLLP